MTDQQKADLKTRGWTQVDGGMWRSPLTGRDFTEREALAIVALKPRGRFQHQLYRTRR